MNGTIRILKTATLIGYFIKTEDEYTLQLPVTNENGKAIFKDRNKSNGLRILSLDRQEQQNLEAKVLTSISCSNKGIYTVKYWELFKMPVSIIAVL